MGELPERPSPQEVEAHFRSLIDREGIARPDAVEHDPEAEELTFLWREPKVAIVIKLSDSGPVDVLSRPFQAPSI